MRTIREATDVNSDDPISKLIIGQLTTYAVLMLLSGHSMADDKEKFAIFEKQAIARFLNELDDKGFAIVKSEVPAVFTQ